ncbi:MAG: tetratricopeptide repeat protein [Candidatus Gastranaerophilaceae bacterium]|jgi:tetratricopeptide (TPR) repeat protein
MSESTIKEIIDLAIQYHRAGALFEAEKLYIEALKQNPTSANSLNLLGLVKYQQQLFDDAIFYIKKAVEITPNAYSYENLGRIYFDTGKFDESIHFYKKAIELESNNFELWFGIAIAYKNKKNLDKAIKSYQKAMDLKPGFTHIYFNLARIYFEKNDIPSAIDCYKKILEYKPDDEDTLYYLGTMYLITQNFEEGWKYFENRISKKFSIASRQKTCPSSVLSQPVWNGELLENKTLYVYYEAGYGDTIHFARYLPLLKARAAKVLFKPQPSLINLFKDSNLNVEILDNKMPESTLKFDAHIPIMSLPYALGLNFEDIPFKKGYLKANPDKIKLYKEKYFRNDKLKIGIKWLGNPLCNQNRAIPFEKFFSLLNLPNTKFYSVQKEAGTEKLINFPQNQEIISLGETFNDFSDTAGTLENFDLIICNDTSIAHLAGALGKQCFVLLPFEPEWRWFLDINYSPWYDSIKIFRQKEPDNWDDVFERVYKELEKLLSAAS